MTLQQRCCAVLAVAGAVFAAAPCHALPVDSVLQQFDLATAGDRGVTLDTLSGREWLDLTQTQGQFSQASLLSPANNCTPTCTTGPLQGWTLATAADVLELFDHAGLPAPDAGFFGCLRYPVDFVTRTASQAFLDCSNNLATFITVLGNTYGTGALRDIGGPMLSFDQIYDLTAEMTGISADNVNGPAAVMAVYCGCDGTGYAFSQPDPDMIYADRGVWLFRVPEPEALSTVGLALVAAGLARRRRIGASAPA